MRPGEVKLFIDVKVISVDKTKELEKAPNIKKKHIDVRRVGAQGKVVQHITGQGGRAWWVCHKDLNGRKVITAYMDTELAKIEGTT